MTHQSITFELATLEDTNRLAQDLAFALHPGDLVFLAGTLGAGKTAFARATLRALAGAELLEVPSPTFTLVQDYELGGVRVMHVDLYRLEEPEEIVELGLLDARADHLLLVEWSERAEGLLGEADIFVQIEISGLNERRITISCAPPQSDNFNRSLQIRQALRQMNWDTANRSRLDDDGSARRYERVSMDGNSAVLMDYHAFQQLDEAALTYRRAAHLSDDMEDFFAIGDELRQRGIHTPKTHGRSAQYAVALLEDLGTEKILDAEGAPIEARYEVAIDALAHLHGQGPPGPAVRHHFDWQVFSAEVMLFIDWYLPDRQTMLSDPGRARYQALWPQLFDQLQQAETGWLIRDVHSPNILWQQHADGLARCGFIDHQDALIGPTAYDVVSLCQDVRTVVPAAQETRLLDRYLAARRSQNPEFDLDAFTRAYRLCGVQRNLKILGIFVRLHKRDNKPRYRRYLPAVAEYVRRLCAAPELAELADWLAAETDLFDREVQG